jgi:hypothetical protein
LFHEAVAWRGYTVPMIGPSRPSDGILRDVLAVSRFSEFPDALALPPLRMLNVTGCDTGPHHEELSE